MCSTNKENSSYAFDNSIHALKRQLSIRDREMARTFQTKKKPKNQKKDRRPKPSGPYRGNTFRIEKAKGYVQCRNGAFLELCEPRS